MLIRAVEFQDNFVRASVQGARQLSLDLNRPELLHRHMAQVAADQVVLNQSRTLPSDQLEQKVVDPKTSPVGERPQSRQRRRESRQPQTGRPKAGATGTKVDLVA